MTTTPAYWLNSFFANAGAGVGQQGEAQTIGLSDGKILTLWTDDTTGRRPGTDIIGTIRFADGKPAGQVNRQFNVAGSEGDEGQVSAAALPDGGFVIAYTSRTGVTALTAVVERYDSEGVRVFSHAIPQAGGSTWNENVGPCISVQPEGDYTLVFGYTTDGGGGSQLARAVTFDFETNQPGRELASLSSSGGIKVIASASLNDGRAITLYSVFDTELIGSGRGQTAQMTIRDAATGQLISVTKLSGISSYAQDVTVLSDGRYVVTFIDEDSNNIVMRIGNDASGNYQLGREILVGTAEGGNNYNACSLTALADGGFFIAWVDGDDTLRGQRFDSAAAKIGEEMIIDGAADSVSDVSLTSDGRILIAYQSAIGEIFQTILDPREPFYLGDDSGEAVTAFALGGTVFGEGGNDSIYGSAEVDLLFGGTGMDIIKGGGGNDSIQGNEDGDTLYGDAGNDFLFGQSGNDVLDGGLGNDSLDGGTGGDTLRGRGGDDTYKLADAALSAIGGKLRFDTVEELPGDGIDTVAVGRVTTIRGTLSAYTLTDNVENGVITGTGAFNLTGNELRNVLTANAGANRLDGGTGVDTASYSASDTGVIVDLASGNASGGFAAGDTLISIENLTGSNFGDILDGSSGRNTIFGGGGNDSLRGGEKADVLSGGDGDDRLMGGQGADKLTGGLGDDTYGYFSLNDAGDEITGWRTDLGNDDHFQFETDAFGGLPEGVLAAQRFQRGPGHEAETKGVRFIYDNAAHELWFDANGSSAGGQTLIASFDRDVGLSAADIIIADSRTERSAAGFEWL